MEAGVGADDRIVLWWHPHREPRRIACLACGETRILLGVETGECPRCHYLGWVEAEELDGSTQRLIMNGAFAHPRRLAPLRPAR
jgi:hypothetical protein